MKIRNQRKTDERLDSRRTAFDKLPEKAKHGQRRPGSRNPTKGSALPSTHK